MKNKLKLLKWLVAFISFSIISFWLFIVMASKEIPNGIEGEKANQLVDDVFLMLNKPAFDTIKTLTWTYRGSHHYTWHKQLDTVEVSWKNYKVIFCSKTSQGRVLSDQILIKGKGAKEILEKAIAFFNNDSFWLVAPFKLREDGTVCKWVQTSQGGALLVTYTKGGTTPGDSYLWYFDNEGRINAWEMWVSILPLKGLRFSWENLENKEGVWFYKTHVGPLDIKLEITDLKVEY